jgi:hypothetical protein
MAGGQLQGEQLGAQRFLHHAEICGRRLTRLMNIDRSSHVQDGASISARNPTITSSINISKWPDQCGLSRCLRDVDDRVK